ncbi:hypothetical protein [Bradyrhizobium sp. UNPA324]|uniref:hypothetical protein n=1 Tax=Bradyrhizobium sp. UNPA324 TaxID=1141174 RepID=UPI001150A11A|nr:hypothetical protein [Bradyrhizobium sp. UNPA324]TQF28863.1 hypothetical protein UNPA324_03775 [Bradyrhizobium sp. UNPA324]
MTFAEMRAKVIQAVLDDRDRSLEGAVERAIRAGAELERKRLHSILSEVTPRPGLERLAILRALDPEETAESVAQFLDGYPIAQAHHASLRRTIHVVDNNRDAQ